MLVCDSERPACLTVSISKQLQEDLYCCEMARMNALCIPIDTQTPRFVQH